MPKQKLIYLAAPLFSLNERTDNRRIIKAVETLMPSVKFLLPQDIQVHSRFNDKLFSISLTKVAATIGPAA